MKIQIIESTTNRPMINTKVQLQVKGANSGFLTLTTDTNGHITLDGKYNGQQIALTNGGMQGQWVTATEGACLMLGKGTGTGTGAGGKQKETTAGGHGGKK